MVGPNGCGKSSVFDAILFHINAYGPIGSTGQKDYTYHSLKGDPSYNYQHINIEFETGNYNTARGAKERQGKQNTLFSFRSPFRYNSELLIRESRAVSEIRLNSFGATTTSSLDQKMEENYRRLQIKYNKYLNDNDCKPSEAKKHIIGELNTGIQNCLNMKIDNLGNIEDGKGTLFFKKIDYVSEFPFNVLSAGEKEIEGKIENYEELFRRIESLNLLENEKSRSRHYFLGKLEDVINESFLIFQMNSYTYYMVNKDLYLPFLQRLLNEDAWIFALNHDICLEMLCVNVN